MKYFSIAILLVVGLCACERKMTVAERDQKIKDSIVAYIMNRNSSISQVDTANVLLEVETLTACSYEQLKVDGLAFIIQWSQKQDTSYAADIDALNKLHSSDPKDIAEIESRKRELLEKVQENRADIVGLAHIRDSISGAMSDCSTNKSVSYAVRFREQVHHLDGWKSDNNKLYVLDPSFKVVNDYDISTYKLVKHRGKWLFGIEREYY